MKNPETGNQTFRTLYAYINEKPEHSYLAVEEIVKRLNESGDNLREFCAAMSLGMEDGFISVVPIPDALMEAGESFKRALLEVKKTKREQWIRKEYKCWVIMKEDKMMQVRYLRWEDIKDNTRLLNPSENLIGIYASFSKKEEKQNSDILKEGRSKSQIRVVRGRLLSCKKGNPTADAVRKQHKSLSIYSPKPRHSSPQLLLASKQPSPSSTAPCFSRLSKSRSKSRSNCSLLTQTKPSSQIHLRRQGNVKQSTTKILQKKKFRVEGFSEC